MAPPWSYLVCGTPRTGSTLLCSLLSSTGVAGHPESYFRQPDERLWAGRFGVPLADDGTFDYRALVAKAARVGSTPNGVFGGRVMWGTMDVLVDGLRPSSALDTAASDIAILEEALGPLRFVHLRRLDTVAQAASWVRAEQTGYWQQGDASLGNPVYDQEEMDHYVREASDHNQAWASWFIDHDVSPLALSYEELIDAPDRTTHKVLDHLGVTLPGPWSPHSPHRRQADGVNAEWIYRHAQHSSSR